MPPPAVRTRRVTTVSLPAGDGPLPPPGRRVPLSPFDVYWAALQPVRRVFLFHPPSTNVPFPDIVRDLKSSLEAVLPYFHPFAGELGYDPADSRSPVAFVCGEGGEGVAFVEAVTTELDFARLVEDGAEHDVDSLRQLVPDIRREELPAPVMAVQLTEFVGGGGGIAVGVALHHAAADGRGIWRFIEMWAAAAAGTEVSRLLARMGTPLHDRRLVHFDGAKDLATVFLRQAAPELPRIMPKQDSSSGQLNHSLSRRTFTLPASAVRHLKRQLTPAGAGTPPSTFATVVAHGWVSIARASGFTDSAPIYALFLADCRAHMTPPVPDAYVGNCLALCRVELSGAELTDQDGPARACVAIRDAVAEVKRDPLADRNRWISKFIDIPQGRSIVMAGSPWFPAYGVDFGFGTPVRVELASMNHDGEMVLVAGKEAGSVQASVALSAEKIPAFCKMFVVES